jgi:hypothetical protein
MKVTDLTQLLHGLPNLNIQAVSNYTFRLNHISLVQIVSSLSQVDAKDYTLGVNCKIGFDKKNNELIVTNHRFAGTSDEKNTNADADILSEYGLNSEGYDLNYSYIFSFESGFWHKISESYRVLINFYPELLVLRENTSTDGVYSLSQEDYITPVTIMVTTQPCKLDGEVDFTLLHRAIQRCEIETKDSVYAGFYVFGSNDLKTWQLLTGSDRKTGKVTDILVTRTHLKVKYYVFLVTAELKLYDVLNARNVNNSINILDVQFYHKLMSKIR